MPTIEAILILTNVFSLVLPLTNGSKSAWFLITWANLSLLVLHGVVEGFRFPMALSYLFVILFTVYACAKMNGRDLLAKNAHPVYSPVDKGR